jgi:hypothetical protein
VIHLGVVNSAAIPRDCEAEVQGLSGLDDRAHFAARKIIALDRVGGGGNEVDALVGDS